MSKATEKSAPRPVRDWKVRSSAVGVEVTLNGQTFELGPSAAALLFDLDRAVAGWNGPAVKP